MSAGKKPMKTVAKKTTPIKKVEESTGTVAHNKRSKKRQETYSSYVYRVLSQVHPDMGISKRAMAVMNSFVQDLFDRLALEGSKLASMNGRSTMGSREIQTAVRLVLPGELSKHAVSEGTKSYTKFANTTRSGKKE